MTCRSALWEAMARSRNLAKSEDRLWDVADAMAVLAQLEYPGAEPPAPGETVPGEQS